jgi:hypothetical protein
MRVLPLLALFPLSYSLFGENQDGPGEKTPGPYPSVKRSSVLTSWSVERYR